MLLKLIGELKGAIVQVFANPTPHNVSLLIEVLRKLLALVHHSDLKKGTKADLEAVLELTIVSVEAVPFSPISVGTNLQQLLDVLLSVILQGNIDSCEKDKLVILIRATELAITTGLRNIGVKVRQDLQGQRVLRAYLVHKARLAQQVLRVV